MPQQFNPLLNTPTNHELRLGYEQSKVRSVIDSYHGRLDAFAEAIQNAVDAIERRWSTWKHEESELTPIDAAPRIRIFINEPENAVEVLDNGNGIELDKLEELLEPYASDKRNSPDPTRGHKGVGTTFLAYGHPSFEIHTRTSGMSEAVGYKIEGGRVWAMAEQIVQPPDYNLVEYTNPSLSQYESGTFVKIKFDSNTNLRTLATILHNKPKMWREVLRSNTALGNVTLGAKSKHLKDWEKFLAVTLEHRDGQEQVPFGFPLPHQPENVLARELQWLQNNPSKKREYSVIYVERDYAALQQLLAAEVAELENSEDEESQVILDRLRKYEVSAYASLAYKNTFYEEQFREQISTPNAQRLSLMPGVGGGVMVASVGMPMGALQSHLAEKMQPQERRRYFLLLEFNQRYSPDIGRKTIPQDLEPLVAWLEDQLLRLLKTQDARLERDKESDTRPKGVGLTKSGEELKSLIKHVESLEAMDHGLKFDGLVLQRTPEWEAEVVVIFANLLASGDLPGYKLRALPGAASRYDALFDYELAAADQEGVSESLRVDANQFVTGPLELSDMWLELEVPALLR
ncbi:ATP-binding protein [Arthrobacter pityocampae]|uniref:ATP-binding protein n=1 Tax=Arthrobacter pityocampae TaxID=547334 RepID=UPI003735AC4C